jgi:hypothetical protein
VTLDEFKATLTSPEPPAGLRAVLLALWHDGRGDWEAAHRTAQEVNDEEGAWVHAYLHRKEGDQGNAEYWYRRANRRAASGSLGVEWDQIAAALLTEA